MNTVHLKCFLGTDGLWSEGEAQQKEDTPPSNYEVRFKELKSPYKFKLQIGDLYEEPAKIQRLTNHLGMRLVGT